MRGTAALAGICALVALGALGAARTATAHVGHAPTYVSVKASGFEPQVVRILAGDRLFWVWDGPSYGRSVTADPGQAEFFDSDPGRPPGPDAHRPPNDLFSHAFGTPGTYTYRDSADPSATGAVIVDPGAEGEAADVDPPVLSVLKASPSAFCSRATRDCRRPGGGTLAFTVSETSDAILRIRPRTRGGSRRILERSLRAGPVRLALPRSLRPGRYTATLQAEDRSGNRSRSRSARFTVLRRAARRNSTARASVHARRCGGYSFRGRDYLVRSQIVSCAFAKRWTRRYLASRSRPSRAWRCNRTPTGTRQRVPFVCRGGGDRAYWVERP